MAEDRDEPPTLEAIAASLASIQKAMREGPVRLPSVPPSEVPTGIDARVISDTVRALIGERIALFLTGDQIRSMIRDELKETFRGVGLPIDEEHIGETSEAVRSAMKWHKRIDRVAAGIAISLLTALGYALLGLFGIKLPSGGSN